MVEPSPADAVRLEADTQRAGEMDPESNSVNRNQWEEPTDLSLPHALTMMSVSFLHPDASGAEGRKNEEGEENLCPKGTVLSQKKPCSCLENPMDREAW